MLIGHKTQRGVCVLSTDQNQRYFVDYFRGLGYRVLIRGRTLELY